MEIAQLVRPSSLVSMGRVLCIGYQRHVTRRRSMGVSFLFVAYLHAFSTQPFAKAVVLTQVCVSFAHVPSQ